MVESTSLSRGVMHLAVFGWSSDISLTIQVTKGLKSRAEFLITECAPHLLSLISVNANQIPRQTGVA
jgi:hypothetical protein